MHSPWQMVCGEFEKGKNGFPGRLGGKFARPTDRTREASVGVFAGFWEVGWCTFAIPGVPAGPGVPATRPVAPIIGDATSIAGFLENTISRVQAKYEHTKYKAIKKDAAKNSLGAKGLLGYQEKYGNFKLTFGCTFERYDGWRLVGEVNDGKFLSPSIPPTP